MALTQRELDDLRYKEEVLRLAKEKQRLMNQVGVCISMRVGVGHKEKAL